MFPRECEWVSVSVSASVVIVGFFVRVCVKECRNAWMRSSKVIRENKRIKKQIKNERKSKNWVKSAFPGSWQSAGTSIKLTVSLFISIAYKFHFSTCIISLILDICFKYHFSYLG